MAKRFLLAATAAVSLFSSGAHAQDWIVRPEWVRAHESFLANDALQGRGSATRDEAIAAAYVAAQFESFGLKFAPGMQTYTQKAEIVRLRLDGPVALTVDGASVADPKLLMGRADGVAGKLQVYAGKKPEGVPAGDVVLVSGDAPAMQYYRAASEKKVKLLIVRDSEMMQKTYEGMGGRPRMPTYLGGGEVPERTAMVILAAAAFDALAKKQGAAVSMTLPGLAKDVSTTTNAVGYLPGTDPKAGVLLLSAHLDHLGVRPDGVIMPGANDDASGTAAVIELARALAAAKQTRRGILFVAYGSEEIGGYGSKYFGAHPPVPLSDIVANVEFEMIGAQDPKLPAGSMMMTGFERSTLGETLRSHGALVSPDPYPDQNFFERSDNYSLAVKGVVAHTLSGWAVTPTYHTSDDTLANLDIAFMARAIQSLVEPVRSLADSDSKPQWKPGGKPAE
ncbi:MAG: M28 family peptidase [Sphingomonas sp.]